MPPRVRRTPLLERVKAYLDPQDLLLWMSEELNNDALDEWFNDWAVPIGIGLNVLFVLGRGASRSAGGGGADDVFGDADSRSGSGWLPWFAAFIVHFLTVLCCWNAFYTFFRKRHYRLFEQPVDEAPATPSAYRVHIDSSPASSSPLRYLQSVILSATASARAYPDPEREVWELSVWDPKPFHLTTFTLFSPGHLLLYYFLLPPTPLDPRPSVTVLTSILFGTLLSLQLSFLKSSFGQQAKDSTLVHGEVMNEYDTKFVRPALNRPVRDVATQTRESTLSPRGTRTREVDVYTPTTIVNRGFKTNPNTNYAQQYDPYDLASQPEPRRPSSTMQRSITTPSLVTPSNAYAQTNGYTQASSTTSRLRDGAGDYSSPLKPHHERLRERTPNKGDGGSLGVHSHANSPLRKTASIGHLDGRESLHSRPAGSPLKRVSTPGGGLDAGRRRDTGRI